MSLSKDNINDLIDRGVLVLGTHYIDAGKSGAANRLLRFNLAALANVPLKPDTELRTKQKARKVQNSRTTK